MIIPVLFYWITKHGHEWATELQLNSFAYDEKHPEKKMQLWHAREEYIATPPGLVLMSVSTACLPRAGAFDGSDLLDTARGTGSIMVYADVETAAWLRAESDRQAEFHEKVAALFLETRLE